MPWTKIAANHYGARMRSKPEMTPEDLYTKLNIRIPQASPSIQPGLTRSGISDVLYDMALLFEQTTRKQKLPDVFARLQLYDTEGSRIGKLTEPAVVLDIAVEPADTEIEIGRVLDKTKYHLADIHRFWRNAIMGQTLPTRLVSATFAKAANP